MITLLRKNVRGLKGNLRRCPLAKRSVKAAYITLISLITVLKLELGARYPSSGTHCFFPYWQPLWWDWVSYPSFHHFISLSAHRGFNYMISEEPDYTARETVRNKGPKKTNGDKRRGSRERSPSLCNKNTVVPEEVSYVTLLITVVSFHRLSKIQYNNNGKRAGYRITWRSDFMKVDIMVVIC